MDGDDQVKPKGQGGGLRNFRKDDSSKGQTSLLRFFRNDVKKKGSDANQNSPPDPEPARPTSPILKTRKVPSVTEEKEKEETKKDKEEILKQEEKPEENDTEDSKNAKEKDKPSKLSLLQAFRHNPTNKSYKLGNGVAKDSEEEKDSEDVEEEKSPVLQRRHSRDEANGNKSPDHKVNTPRSKPLFVQMESDSSNDTVDNPLGGMSMKALIDNSKSKLNASIDHDQDSQDSPIFVRVNVGKRTRRVVSDDEDEDDLKPPAKKLQVNGSHKSLQIRSVEEDGEMIEKYIVTFMSLYPRFDKMEIMDIFKGQEWDAQKTIKQLDQIEKEKKNKALQQNKEEKIKEKSMEKTLQELKKNAKKEKIRAQKETWRAKAAKVEEEMEEEEEDYKVSSAKVYDSDSDSDAEPDIEMTSDRRVVLQFFNEATVGELAAIGGCSKKKAEVIAQIRPFADWAQIISKFKTEKYISTDLLNQAKNVLHVQNTVQKLMKRCENIAKEMQSIVARIVSGDEDAGISKQPGILNPELSLKNYQLIGLNWLVLMHEQGLNGVLADEMGLGKTVQAISFLAYLKETEDPEEISLIVVPSSTLDNWARELELWCPSLNVLQYHGTQEERRGIRSDIMSDNLEEPPDVILTTYTMVTVSAEDRALFKKLRFNTIVLDEAHMLKNMASQRYENLMKIKGLRRVLLTGTPLQNNLVELMSILIFVMPQLFDSKKEELKRVFSMFPKSDDSSGKGKFERERIEQAKRIMKPFFLRRLKSDVLKDLPAKSEEIIYASMSERQQKIYSNTVLTFSKKARQQQLELEKFKLENLTELEDLEATGKSPKKKPGDNDTCSNMVMTLRKIANHPLLTRNHYKDNILKDISKVLKKTSHRDSVLEYIIEDLQVMSDFEINATCHMYPAVRKHMLPEDLILNSGKFQQLDELLPRLKNEGARVLIFSQFVIMLNILEKYMKIRGHQYLRLDGTTLVGDRQELIDEFNDNEDIFIFMLSTRAGGLGINLTSANTVILHDIDFNPYNDKQAEDRCHRVGQVRPVEIIRLISKGSIEEGMLKIAQDKLQLEKDVTGTGDETHKKGDVVTLLKDALGLAKSDESTTDT